MKLTQKQLRNPTEQQKKTRAQGWAKRLKANSKKARCAMRDGEGGRCCLCVAEDYAVSCGLDLEAGKSGQNDGTPEHAVAEFFGWNDTNPDMTVVIKGEESTVCASELNDDSFYRGKAKGYPHRIIAEIVLNNFSRKKPVKIKELQ